MTVSLSMPENISISVNGQSFVPPGFRFHPTEEELLLYYLKKKVENQKIDMDVIRDLDLNKLEPWDIQEQCRIGSTPPNDWYFFSHKDKKYPTGTRTNRATAAGFWKATGRDKVIRSNNNSRRIGMRKTLVFYEGRAPHGHKSDWIMHEYRHHDHNAGNTTSSEYNGTVGGETTKQEEGWVVCRVFKKTNHQKCPYDSSIITERRRQVVMSSMNSSDDEGSLDQILDYMMKGTKACYQPFHGGVLLHHQDNNNNNNNNNTNDNSPTVNDDHRPVAEPPLNDWTAIDRLVASQLNDETFLFH